VKLIFASAVLSLILQPIYEWLSIENFSDSEVSNGRISINIGDVFSAGLYELLFLFIITFCVLSGVRFLYFYIVSRHNNTKNLP